MSVKLPTLHCEDYRPLHMSATDVTKTELLAIAVSSASIIASMLTATFTRAFTMRIGAAVITVSTTTGSAAG